MGRREISGSNQSGRPWACNLSLSFPRLQTATGDPVGRGPVRIPFSTPRTLFAPCFMSRDYGGDRIACLTKLSFFRRGRRARNGLLGELSNCLGGCGKNDLSITDNPRHSPRPMQCSAPPQFATETALSASETRSMSSKKCCTARRRQDLLLFKDGSALENVAADSSTPHGAAHIWRLNSVRPDKRKQKISSPLLIRGSISVSRELNTSETILTMIDTSV